MTPKQKILNYYLNESDKVISRILDEYFIEVTSDRLWQILTDYFEFYDNPVELIYEKLDSDTIFKIVSENYLEFINPLGSLNFRKTILPADIIDDSIIKGIVKSKGEIWEIHKNDQDYFPSDPHAHNCETGLKLHLGNGELYRKRKYISKIKKKDLLLIRAMISKQMNYLVLPNIN